MKDYLYRNCGSTSPHSADLQFGSCKQQLEAPGQPHWCGADPWGWQGKAAPTRSSQQKPPHSYTASLQLWASFLTGAAKTTGEQENKREPPHCSSSSQGMGDGWLHIYIQRRVPGTLLHLSAAAAGTPLELWQVLKHCAACSTGQASFATATRTLMHSGCFLYRPHVYVFSLRK